VDLPSCNNFILAQRHRGIFWIARKAIETLEYNGCPHVVHTSQFDRFHPVEKRESLSESIWGSYPYLVYPVGKVGE
jgi:hypothetical protein